MNFVTKVISNTVYPSISPLPAMSISVGTGENIQHQNGLLDSMNVEENLQLENGCR